MPAVLAEWLATPAGFEPDHMITPTTSKTREDPQKAWWARQGLNL